MTTGGKRQTGEMFLTDTKDGTDAVKVKASFLNTQ
jgi:hypothetical protein